MAFKPENIPNFGSLEPSSSQIRTGFGAPREIELSDQEVKDFKKAKEELSKSSITVDSLFSLFNEWQSDKTKSIKRFVLSITFLLGLTIPAGVNITEIDLFGVSVAEGMSSYFLLTILGVLICSFGYYDYLRRKDKKLHSAQIDSVQKNLEPCLRATETVDEIVRSNNHILSAEPLFRDFRDGLLSRKDTALDTYKAFKFYESKLANTKTSQEIVEKIEFYGMYALGLFAIIAVANDFLDAQIVDAIQVILSRAVTYFLIPF